MEFSFFLAHASENAAWALELHRALRPEPSALDQVTVGPGRQWQVDLRAAQVASRATVVLVSRFASAAYYLGEEVGRAISLMRQEAHRVFPVYLEGMPAGPNDVPYGLFSLQGIDGLALGPAGVADELKRALRSSIPETAPHPPSVPPSIPPESLYRLAIQLGPVRLELVVERMGGPRDRFRTDHEQLAVDLVLWATTLGDDGLLRLKELLSSPSPHEMARESVFVSYRRRDTDGYATLIAEDLRRAFGDGRVFIDKDGIEPGTRFPERLRNSLEQTRVLVCLIGNSWHRTYHPRSGRRLLDCDGDWVRKEVAYGLERQGDVEVVVVTVDDDWTYEPEHWDLPPSLNALPHTQRLSAGRMSTRDRAYIVTVVGVHLGVRPRVVPGGTALERGVIDTTRIASASAVDLVGRENDTNALIEHIRSGTTGVAWVVGAEGCGKSALASACIRVFRIETHIHLLAWTFRHGDISSFFDWALEQLEQPAGGRNDEQRARVLAACLARTRTILVLDGLEVHQRADGSIVDRALCSLVEDAARLSDREQSIVLVTSRVPPPPSLNPNGVGVLQLGNLDRIAGAQLLRRLEVEGTHEDLAQLSDAHLGHPLLLILQSRARHGTADERTGLPAGPDSTARERLLRNALDAQISGLASASHALLRILAVAQGGVSRTTMLGMLRAGLGEPTIDRAVDTATLDGALAELKSARLVFQNDSGRFACHDMISAAVAARIESGSRAELETLHQGLATYHLAHAPAQPSTIEELTPYYLAIRHGCMTGRYEEALEVYWTHVSRERQFFSQKALGAYASDLQVLQSFLNEDWSPIDGLGADEQQWVLAVVAFLLTSLGRLEEAVIPRQQDIELAVRLTHWGLAASDTKHLSDLLLQLGRVGEALVRAEDSVAYARRFANAPRGGSRYSAQLDVRYLEVSCLCMKAKVLHAMDRVDEAGDVFRTAEDLHGARLGREEGAAYARFLLDTCGDDQLAALESRCEALYEASAKERWLDNRGEALLVYAEATARKMDPMARERYDDAVGLIRESGRLAKLPRALAARARYTARNPEVNEDRSTWERDLVEARDIARRGSMRLRELEVLYVADQVGIWPNPTILERAKSQGYLRLGNGASH